MKLAATIDIYAGGPGSGCRGPNCGRPIKEDGAGATAKLMQGDRVVLTKPLKVFSNKKMWFKTAPVGTPAIVRAIKPAFGLHPEMIKIELKNADPEWVEREHVYLTKADVVKPQVAPVSKKKTAQSFTTKEGAKVTVIKPASDKFRNPQALTKQKHPLSGRFRDISGVLYQMGFKGPVKNQIKIFGEQNANSKVFFAQRKGDTDKLRGTTVFVHRYFSGPKKGVLIREFNAGQYGQVTQNAVYKLGQKWEYSGMNEFRYKNFGSAAGLLNKRYGIKIKLKDF